MPSFSCTVEDSRPGGIRLDRYAAEYLKILSRSQIKAKNLKARLNGRLVKISRILKGGEYLELSWDEAETCFLVPEELPLEVIYEDERVIVINKSQGMVVHPGAGNRSGTLANALLYRKLGKPGVQKPEPFISDPVFAETCIRPGIVHRLDKDTSGLIIAAWDWEAHSFLADQFRARTVRKSYAALVCGCPKNRAGCIDRPIARSRRDRKTFTVSGREGRRSITWYKLVRSYGNYSLLLVRPRTGRTHQIRVHLKYLGNPVLGDPIYGSNNPLFKKASLMLHAKRLSLVLPGQSGMTTFRTALPERFIRFIHGEKAGSF